MSSYVRMSFRVALVCLNNAVANRRLASRRFLVVLICSGSPLEGFGLRHERFGLRNVW